MDVRHILDLDRYPLHDLAGARGLELISACREALADHGMFDLTGFVRPEALVRRQVAGHQEVHDRPQVGNAILHRRAREYQTVRRADLLCRNRVPC